MNPKVDSTGSKQIPDSAGSKIGAGAAGAGTGTLLVLLANNLPNDNAWKSWLVLLAPAASILVSVVYTWVRSAIEEYLDKRELQKVIRQAKQTLQEALGNSNTSEDHKHQLRKELEELEILLVKSDLARIRNLTKPIT